MLSLNTFTDLIKHHVPLSILEEPSTRLPLTIYWHARKLSLTHTLSLSLDLPLLKYDYFFLKKKFWLDAKLKIGMKFGEMRCVL